MRKHPLAVLCLVIFVSPSFASGYFWDFLGSAQIGSGQDHDNIAITRHDGPFRALQLRVTGEAIFFDRVVIHFADGNTQQIAVGDRIGPQGKNYVIELTGERRVLESVELWYYRESWQHRPSVTLYGTR
jgi:hypothetical protein